MEAQQNMSLFLELIWPHLLMLTKKIKDILILGEGPNEVLDDAALTAEIKYPINFKQPKKKKRKKRFVLSVNNNACNSFLFLNTTKMYQFKVKDSKIKYYTLCLGNFSKDFSIKSVISGI